MAQSLSTIASTAAFDKNPQSKERGITLDLGFSSFGVDSPEHLKDKFSKVQYTLVDCPGHGECGIFLLSHSLSMIKAPQSSFPSFPNLYKIKVHFNKLDITDLNHGSVNISIC